MGCPSFKNTCDYPRAYISTFVPGTGQSRAWLSVIVGFDKPIPNDLFEKYFQYISCKLNSKIFGTIKRGDTILFKLQDRSITQEEFQRYVDEANSSYPEFKTPKEIAEQKAAEIARKEKEAKVAQEGAYKKQAEEARLRKETEERAKKERRIAATKESERIAAQLKKEQERKHDAISAIGGGEQANVKNQNRLPLLKAILMRKNNDVKTLLERGANPNIIYMDKHIIHWVIKNGELEIALYLINAGADFSGIIEGEQDIFTYISTHFNTYIPGATFQLHDELLNALVVHGYNIKANFQSTNLLNNAWYLAITNNQSNRVGCFLGWANSNIANACPCLKVANPNQIFIRPDGSSWSALIEAIECYGQSRNVPGGQISIINSLLAAGALINHKLRINRHSYSFGFVFCFHKK